MFSRAQVTAVEPRSRGSTAVDVYIDGRFWRRTNKRAAALAGLSAGMQVDKAVLAEVVSIQERKAAEEIALRLLEYRPRTVAEIRSKLTACGLPEEVAEGEIEHLSACGYLDDTRFAGAWIDERIRVKHYGRRRIMSELLVRGIDIELARTELDRCCPESDEQYRAEELVQAKFGSPDSLNTTAEQRRACQWLARKGYTADVARAAIRRLLDTPIPQR